MKSTAVLVFAALATMAATPEPPRQGRQTPGASQTLTAPYVQPGPVTPPPGVPYLFFLGPLPVRLWAPVPPPYNARANGNLASRPIWWDSSAAW